MTTEANQIDPLDDILGNIVYPMVGPRCKTKDRHDFSELKEDERCLVCATYEEIDQAKASIESLMLKERRDELENVLPYLNDWAITEYYKDRIARLNTKLGDQE